jgi:thiamine transport system permease protein
VDRPRPALTADSGRSRSHRRICARSFSAVERNRAQKGFVAALAVAPVIFLLLFYVWPVATLLSRGVAAPPSGIWEIAWFTLRQATASTILTVAAGLAPAYVMARYRFPGRRLLSGLLTAVFVLPTVVMGAAILALFPASIERSIWAILAAHVAFNLAVVVRTVGAVWEHLPGDLEAAAATLGASPVQVAREITLPLLRPAIFAAASIVFVFTFTSFGVIRIVGDAGTSTLEVEIWRRATQLGDLDAAATIALGQLVVIAVFVGWSAWQQRRHSRALALRPLARRRPPRPGPERRFVAVTATLTSVVVAAPLVALVERSLRTPSGYSLAAWRHLGRAEIRPGISVGVDPLEALAISLRTAAVATVVAVVIGGLAALAIVAWQRGGRVLDTGLMLPIATSAVTIGFGILITFDQDPFDWRGSWWIVPVGHALIAIPFVVRTALPVLRGIDPRLHEAAATLGASPERAWREITVPHPRRPLVVAAGLAAAISLGEFGATSFLSRSGSETVPIAIERLLGRTGTALQAQGYVLATILAVATVAVVVLLDVGGDVRRTPRPRDARRP